MKVMMCIKTCGLVAANGTTIREHNKYKTAVIRLHQRTDSHLSHEGGFSLFAAIAVSLPEAERGIRFCGEAVRAMDVAQWKLLKC